MAAVDDARPQALDERLFEATVGALELFGVYLGTRLGLYRALTERGPLTASGLAGAAGIDERYAREWSEQQAVAGMLTVDDPDLPAADRRFALPEAHRAVLTDPEDARHVAPFADLVVGIAGALDEVVEAYRSGGGVPFSRYGRALREGQGAINRPAFTSDLLTTWLPAAGMAERLARPGARVADVGCGHGWAAIAVAGAYPHATVVGIDLDAPSIEEARQHALDRGVDATFLATDAGSLRDHGPFDVILILEVLHDLADPVGVLQACRAALSEGGAVLVADEAVAPRFTAPGDELERMMYGWSIAHCLPASRTEPDSAALGTVLREDRLRQLAGEAGFREVDVVDADGGFFRLYRLDP